MWPHPSHWDVDLPAFSIAGQSHGQGGAPCQPSDRACAGADRRAGWRASPVTQHGYRDRPIPIVFAGVTGESPAKTMAGKENANPPAKEPQFIWAEIRLERFFQSRARLLPSLSHWDADFPAPFMEQSLRARNEHCAMCAGGRMSETRSSMFRGSTRFTKVVCRNILPLLSCLAERLICSRNRTLKARPGHEVAA